MKKDHNNTKMWKDLNGSAMIFLAVNPKNKNQIIDIRYSGIPNEIGGLWGIQLNSKKHNDEHVEFVSMRSTT